MFCCQLWKSKGCEELSGPARGRRIPQKSQLGLGSVPADPNSRFFDSSVQEELWEQEEFCTWMCQLGEQHSQAEGGEFCGHWDEIFPHFSERFGEHLKHWVWHGRGVLEFWGSVAGPRCGLGRDV